MKIRTSFVSNSSSSSFIVAHREELTAEGLRVRLTKAFDIPANSILKPFEKVFVETLLQIYYDDFEDWIKDHVYGNTTKEDVLKQYSLLELYQEGWKFRVGSLSWNEGEAEETLLANHSLDYKDEYIFIKTYI